MVVLKENAVATPFAVIGWIPTLPVFARIVAMLMLLLIKTALVFVTALSAVFGKPNFHVLKHMKQTLISAPVVAWCSMIDRNKLMILVLQMVALLRDVAVI